MIWNCCPKEIRKEGGFGAGGGVPGRGTCVRRQASIAWLPKACRANMQSFLLGTAMASGTGGGVTCAAAVSYRAECTCKHESSYKQAPNSRSLFCFAD